MSRHFYDSTSVKSVIDNEIENLIASINKPGIDGEQQLEDCLKKYNTIRDYEDKIFKQTKILTKVFQNTYLQTDLEKFYNLCAICNFNYESFAKATEQLTPILYLQCELYIKKLKDLTIRDFNDEIRN